MSKPNLKSESKRKRQFAKLAKRQAKDEKRALRKAERSTVVDASATPVRTSAPTAPPPSAAPTGTPRPAVAPVPTTLAAAALRWKTSKIAKAKAAPAHSGRPRGRGSV
jgi:hypothetical protein